MGVSNIDCYSNREIFMGFVKRNVRCKNGNLLNNGKEKLSEKIQRFYKI